MRKQSAYRKRFEMYQLRHIQKRKGYMNTFQKRVVGSNTCPKVEPPSNPDIIYFECDLLSDLIAFPRYLILLLPSIYILQQTLTGLFQCAEASNKKLHVQFAFSCLAFRWPLVNFFSLKLFFWIN